MRWFDVGKVICVVSFLMLTSCTGETLIKDRFSLEYLDAKPGKPLVYPEGVQRPEQSLEYSVPKISTRKGRADYNVNEVVKPPRIVPIPEKPVVAVKEKEKREWKVKNGHAKRTRYVRVTI